MSPKAQQLAIAKACGVDLSYELPDYVNDLNAIVGAVRDHPRRWSIFARVAHLVDPQYPAATATAAQWSEAFLKELRLWKR